MIALAVQLIQAQSGRKKDYSARVGDPGRGVLYNFTEAMDPQHKETASRHPGEFAVGLLLHAGAKLSILLFVLTLISESLGSNIVRVIAPLFAVSFFSGLFLLIRRVRTPHLSYMSVPDDYMAILATCVFCAISFFKGIGRVEMLPYLIAGTLLFLYIPFGKLRHIAFFFAARADYGMRLGYRGVYPPPKKEGADVR